MDVEQFHYDVARAQLDFAMNALKERQSATGVENWQSGQITPDTPQQTTLTQDVEHLSAWLDAYGDGTATLEAWREIMAASIANCREVDWLLFEREHAFDAEWLMAKLRAEASEARRAQGVTP